jgi:hypothetical protein
MRLVTWNSRGISRDRVSENAASARDRGWGAHDQVFGDCGTEPLHTPDMSCPLIVAHSGPGNQLRSLIAFRKRNWI